MFSQKIIPHSSIEELFVSEMSYGRFKESRGVKGYFRGRFKEFHENVL